MTGGAGFAGRRVLVTRAAEQAEALVVPLEERGAVAVVCPTIEVVSPPDTGPLDAALASLADYDWVLFTSANAVRFAWRRLEAAGEGAEAFADVRVVAIGPATADTLRERGVAVALVPREYVAESLFDALGPANVQGRRFLLPRAAEARDVLPQAIRDAGGRIDVVTAYVTQAPAGGRAALDAALAEGPLDAAIFTSASTVRHFVDFVGGEACARAVLRGVVVACIGPVAAAAAKRMGLTVDVVPRQYTIPGLVEALEGHFERTTP